MTTTLLLPACLYGRYLTVQKEAQASGRWCGEQFQRSGVFPHPELRPVTPDETVFTHEIVDFEDEAPAWRLYMASEIEMSVYAAAERKYLHLAGLYEASSRQTAWGAMHFLIEGDAPESAERIALRIKAVLAFWDSLQHSRYLHQKLNTFLDLEGLLTAACGWVLAAWCPEAGPALRSRFEVAAERMARATREDCIETILSHHGRLLSFADRKKLHHPSVVTQLDFWREQLTTMNAEDFARISAVRPGAVLGMMYRWDRQLKVP